MKHKDFILLTGGLLLLNEILKPVDKKAIGAVQSDIDDLIRFTITSKSNVNKKATIETVGEEEAKQLKAITEEDLFGFIHTVDAYSIKHILKQHGNQAKEQLRGQVAVTINDFYLIPAIVKNADIITVSKTKLGLKAILYQKQIGDTYYYIEEIRSGKKELAATSLYKRKAAKKQPKKN